MIQIQINKIKGHYDFELNIPRSAPLTYHIAFNDEQEPDGMIFLIPGFGEDADIDYQHNLMRHLVKSFNLMAVFVEYHAIFSRPSSNDNSAKCHFGNIDIEILLDTLKKYDITLDENRLDFDSVISQMGNHVSQLKKNGVLAQDFLLPLWATLAPSKEEYQNFGILQSLDILTVLHHLVNIKYKNILGKKPIFATGSSHGGYIAMLLMKFAPQTFDSIIENSCYVKPPLNYIVGLETNPLKAEVCISYPNLTINAFTLTAWTTIPGIPNYFSKSAYEIRDLSDPLQLQQFAQYKSKTSLISYHSTHDTIASYSNKKEYINKLKNKKHLYTINSKENVDGKLIKNLNHAMGMSNKELLNFTLPKLIKEYTLSPTDICLNSKIIYKTSQEKTYTIDFSKEKLQASLS